MNFIDYLNWRGDITFAEKGLNEVDNLIFSELAYVDMDGLPAEGEEGMTLAQLSATCMSAENSHHYSANDPLPLLQAAAETDRFRDVIARYYVSETDDERHIQFSAVTFFYTEGEAYVAYRGTDGTIVGWREDFNMSFLDATAGQRAAAEYLDRVASLTDCRLTVGGHSKGGNFAVYAAAFCDEAVRDSRIVRVYSNDGPGFKREVAEGENIRAILPKVIKFLPDASIVGILLAGGEERRFIRSSEKGVAQHDPYSWSVMGTRFAAAESRSALSVFIEDTLSVWLSSLDDDRLRTFVDVFFDSLTATGAVTLAQINENKFSAYSAILKALGEVESDRKHEVQQMLMRLVASGVDVMKESSKKG